MAVFLVSSVAAPPDARLAVAGTRVAADPPSDRAGATGTLYICESQLLFADAAGCGFSLRYQSIAIHAVSRDASDAPHLYCQLDCRFPGTPASAESDDDDEQFSELRFYPGDADELDAMFDALCACAALNPDAGDESEDSAGGGGGSDKAGDVIRQIDDLDPSALITSEDQLDRLTPRGRDVLAHLESVLEASAESGGHERFADADEEADSDTDGADP
ncbi:Methylosome subunit pICln [Coemansia helicoidea]|uniref:Methylosome subunit pICln n=1 Tax=Coemansia helicoidea TaxID=1286919 RepID=A0ACC1KTK0_9FUNG|nr:Methylosome subunit pICln [Coemansia helicoidea]